MNHKRELSDKDQKLINEWLEKNEVIECKAGQYTDPEDIKYTFKAGKRGKSK